MNEKFEDQIFRILERQGGISATIENINKNVEKLVKNQEDQQVEIQKLKDFKKTLIATCGVVAAVFGFIPTCIINYLKEIL